MILSWPGVVITLVALLLLWLVKALVVHAVRRRTGFGASVARALDPAISALLLSVALAWFRWYTSFPAAVDRVLGLVHNALWVVAVVLLVDAAAMTALRRLRDRVTTIDLSQAIVRGLARGVIFIVGLGFVLNSLGVEITPIIASLGVASLAVALALQGPLSNVFAGMLILADRSLNPGDFISLETGEKGWIVRIGLRHTSIRLLADEIVIVPNDKLVTSTVHNASLPSQPMSIRVQVGVHYDSDLARVEEVTLDVARHVQRTVEGAVPDWEPLIRYHTFDSSSINFTVVLRVQEFVAGYLLKHEFIKALHARYRQEGIVIPFPLRTLDIPDRTADKLRSLLRPGDKA